MPAVQLSAATRAIDRLTRHWMRATGTLVDLDEAPWLDGPTGDPGSVGGWAALPLHHRLEPR